MKRPWVCALHHAAGHAEHGGRLYLVMKLYAGSLEEHLRQTGPLEPQRIVEFGLQLALTARPPSPRTPPPAGLPLTSSPRLTSVRLAPPPATLARPPSSCHRCVLLW